MRPLGQDPQSVLLLGHFQPRRRERARKHHRAGVLRDVDEAARPGQDLSTVRLQSDGCYYWLWSGPVEDTLIPLESREGRAICARRQGGGASSEES